MIVEILLGMSLTLNIIGGYALLNSIKKIETFEDYFFELREGLEYILGQVRSIDLRGAFEADDEVGLVFKAMKGMIESLGTFLEKE